MLARALLELACTHKKGELSLGSGGLGLPFSTGYLPPWPPSTCQQHAALQVQHGEFGHLSRLVPTARPVLVQVSHEQLGAMVVETTPQ